jgi:hypothetical protein
MKSWLALSLASLVVIQADAAFAAPVPAEYTVQEGDTCGGLAAKFYGDSRRVDLIHAANPTWGAPPHVLKPGDVIKLSPKPARALPPDPKAPEATIARPHGTVTVDGQPAQAGQTLARGAKVTTEAGGTVELVYADESRVRLGERSQVIVGAPKNTVKGSPAGDAVLVAGEERTKMSDPNGRRPLAISTEAARVQMRGEVKVSAEQANVTRVAAYKGTSNVTGRNKTVDVREGFGVKTEAGKVPGKPKPLPPAPMFGAPPPAVIFAGADGKAEITGSYGPGSGPGDMPSSFRVQVGKDGDFADLLSDTVVPASSTGLSIPGLGQGSYFVRVSAIDAESFEGPFSPTQRVIIGDIKVTPSGKRRATVVVSPAGAYCGVGSGPLAPTAGAFEIDTVRATSVRCAITADGAVTVREIAGDKIHPKVTDATVTHPKGNYDEGELRIVLTDAEGAPIDGVEVKPVPGDEASIGVFVSAGKPGTYTAPARWQHGAAELAFAIHVGDEYTGVKKVTLDHAPADKPSEDKPTTGPIAPETRSAVEIHADGGVAFVNNGLQQFGGRGRVGAGYSLRLGPGIIALGIDGGFEGYNREEFPAADTSGNTAGRVAVGQLHAFSIGIPLQYRYGTYDSRFRPYIGVTPEALFENASFSHLVGDHLASSVDQGSAKVLGLTGLIGGEVKIGPGAAFIEGGYRGTTVASRDVASVNMRGIQTGLGYRLIIGL